MSDDKYSFDFDIISEQRVHYPGRFFLGYQSKLESAHHKNLSLLTEIYHRTEMEEILFLTWLSEVSLESVEYIDYSETGKKWKSSFQYYFDCARYKGIFVEAKLHEDTFCIKREMSFVQISCSSDAEISEDRYLKKEYSLYLHDRDHLVPYPHGDLLSITLKTGSAILLFRVLNKDAEDDECFLILHITRVE